MVLKNVSPGCGVRASLMPFLEVNISICFVSVLDDEDSNVITAGSIVTVNVRLVRRNLSELFDRETLMNGDVAAAEEPVSEEKGDMEEDLEEGMELEDDTKEEVWPGQLALVSHQWSWFQHLLLKVCDMY